MQKGGPLKILTVCKGALKKITTDFPLKIEFTCLGWPVIFMAKKGGPEFFFCGLKGGGGGGGENAFRDKYFLHQAPLTSVCERSLIIMFFT